MPATTPGTIFSSLAGCLTKTSENGAVNGSLPFSSVSLSYAAFDFTVFRQGPTSASLVPGLGEEELVSEFLTAGIPAAGHLTITN